MNSIKTDTKENNRLCTGVVMVLLSGAVPGAFVPSAHASDTTTLNIQISVASGGQFTPVIPTIHFGGLENSAAVGASGSLEITPGGATNFDGVGITANHINDPGRPGQFMFGGLVTTQSAFASLASFPVINTNNGSVLSITSIRITGALTVTFSGGDVSETVTPANVNSATGRLNIGGTLQFPNAPGLRAAGSTSNRVVIAIGPL